MKLTGEYQIHDDGVTIEGRIHGSHIAELREKFMADAQRRDVWLSRLYLGDVSMIPLEHRNKTVFSLGSNWFSFMNSKGKIVFEDVMRDLGFQRSRMDVPNEFIRMGLGVDHSSGLGLLYERRLRWRENGKTRTCSAKVVHCGWVFNNTQADGSFKVDLYGLVNRHILSVVLGKATTYAKLLDHESVLKAADDADNFRRMGWF